jgi:hypothetical protein
MDKKEIKAQLRSAGAQAMEGIKKLAQAGSVRRLRVTDPNGKVLVQLPFSVTVLGAFIAPVWVSAALLGAVATGHAVDVERIDAEGNATVPGRTPAKEREVHAPH